VIEKIAGTDIAGGKIDLTVRVIPQGLGSLFDILFDDWGRAQNAQLLSQRIGIIDIGFYTTDFLTIDGLEIIEKQTIGYDNGVSTAYELIAKDIEKFYNLKTSILNIEIATSIGHIRVFGEDKDISEITSRRLLELATEIKAQAKTLWGNAADLDEIILTGGGANTLKKYLGIYKHAIVAEDPQFANARGYYKYARRIG